MKLFKLLFVAMCVAGGLQLQAQNASQAEKLFASAQHREVSEGDLPGAIDLYKQVAARAGMDRALAARSLLRLAECYQKLGDTQSRKVYEQLVRDFSDHKESGIARARLGPDVASAGGGIVARQLWAGAGSHLGELTIAADGHTVVSLDRNVADVAIRDLGNSAVTPLKLVDSQSVSYAEWPVLSPDQRRVAYAWSGPELGWKYQVRIAPAIVGAKPQPIGTNTFQYCYIRGWSPDGQSLLVTTIGEGNVSQIGWMSVADGQLKTLKSLDWQGPGLLALSPDGKFIAYDVLVERARLEREIRILASDGSNESVTVRSPGINQSPVWTRDGSHLVFKSDRSGTFGLWSLSIRDGKPEGAPALVKSAVGDVSLVGFSGSGSLVYTLLVGTRDIYGLDLDSASKRFAGRPIRIVDTFVGSNINPSVSPDGKTLGYMSLRDPSSAGSWASTLVFRSLEDGAERALPVTFRYGSRPAWYPDGKSVLVAARNVQNNTTLYKVDVTSGKVDTLINTGATAPPLLALSVDGRTAFAAPDAKLVAYDLATGRGTPIEHVGAAKGLAVSPDGQLIAFSAHEYSDRSARASLYIANADGTTAHQIWNTTQMGDLPWSIAWSPDSRSLYIDKGDGAPGHHQLAIIPVTGGAPATVGELPIASISPLDLSKDGKRLVFGAGGPPRAEVWALDNVLPK